MKEPLPLATIHAAVLEFLRHRDDIVLFGAQAVNAYVEEPRMTQDVDFMSTSAPSVAESLRKHLAEQFHIAVRIREVAAGRGFRVFQLRQPKNRHLADVRQVDQLPPNQLVAQIRVATPPELIAQKMISCVNRAGQPKADTDRRDLKLLLLAHPALKTTTGPVADRLKANHAQPSVFDEWQGLVESPIEADEEYS